MSTPSDPVRLLQSAARLAGRHVAPGVQIGRVTLTDISGEKVLHLTIPPAGTDEPVAIDTTPELLPGWSFSGGTARFDGTDVPIRGRKLDVLRVLACADGPLRFDDLRPAWGGYPAEESTIRWTLAELRKDLKRLFTELDGDPIESGTAGYTLVIR